MRIKICAMCERPFLPARFDARYCSTACKQKAYRRRVDPEVGSIGREKERQTKIAITKQETRKRIVCAWCGWEFERSILETNRIYCSNACRQAAYRARKREEQA